MRWLAMGGPFHESPYTPLGRHDFGPTSPYRVAVHNAGMTVAIGDHTDTSFRLVPTWVQPVRDVVDVVVHGLPGRFIERLNGNREIPALVVAELVEVVGVLRGTPSRLLTCHAAELLLSGM